MIIMYCPYSSCAAILQPEVELATFEMNTAYACTHSGSPHNVIHSASIIVMHHTTALLAKVLLQHCASSCDLIEHADTHLLLPLFQHVLQLFSVSVHLGAVLLPHLRQLPIVL